MGLNLQDIIGGGTLGAVSSIIKDFKGDPNAKNQLAELVEQNSAAFQLADLQAQVKLNEAAGENIRSETGSNDHFTSRARPMFMYIIEAILAFNYIGIPLAKIFGYTGSPIDLPTNLLTLFGVCVTGYIGARSLDKLMAAPGDSSLSVGNLIKLGQKS